MGGGTPLIFEGVFAPTLHTLQNHLWYSYIRMPLTEQSVFVTTYVELYVPIPVHFRSPTYSVQMIRVYFKDFSMWTLGDAIQ